MVRCKAKAESSQSNPEMVDELTRQEIATWYKDGKLTPIFASGPIIRSTGLCHRGPCLGRPRRIEGGDERHHASDLLADGGAHRGV